MKHSTLSNRFTRLCAAARRWNKDEAGAVAIIAALAFPVLVGGMGLGAETGYWYVMQRKLQHASDMAAHAGAIRKRAGDGVDQINAAALQIATQSGLSPVRGTILVNSPPASGAKAGSGDSVEVLLTQQQPRLISLLFSSDPITLKARAVASIVGGSRACVLALSPTAPGALTVTGSTQVTLQGCDIASNSNAAEGFLMSGSGSLSANCGYSVGGAVSTGKLTLTECASIKTSAPVVRDPYASLPEPAVIGACQNATVNGGTLTPSDNHPSGVKSMRFCNGLNVKGKVSFGPGLYIIEGGEMSINNGDLTSSELAGLAGPGVTFFFTNGGSVKLGGNANLNLSAPTTGPFAGLLFFGSRNNTKDNQLGGNSDSTLKGAVYMPDAHLQFTGNSSVSDGCVQIIARTITFTGNSTLGASCDPVGTRRLVTGETVKIVE